MTSVAYSGCLNPTNRPVYTTLDPLDFDRKCDGSLPLEDMISYDPSVRKLFEDIDTTKVRVWGLTNAYRPVSYVWTYPAASLITPIACRTRSTHPKARRSCGGHSLL